MSTQPVLITGAGITGLSIAYELQQRGIPFQLLEAGPQAGGVISSLHVDGYELDKGPNSFGATPETMAFISALGLQDAVMEAAPVSRNRFLIRYDRLHAISPHPLKILGSDYISRGAKWRLFTERFRKAQPPGGEESVSAFVQRRFGREICDYLFDPILGGIYAGNPDLLSVQETLPMLPRWEQQYGSVTKGLMKEKQAMGGRKIIAFRGGNAVLTDRLLSLLKGSVRFHARITGITPTTEGYTVEYNENGQTASLVAGRIIFATPAYSTANIIHSLDAALAGSLHKIPYPRMGVLHLGFGEEAQAKAPAGFGFLAPHAAGKHFLGAICSSAIFPSRAPAGKTLFTVFMGGARQEQLFDQLGEERLQQQVISELMALLQLNNPPEMRHFSRWERAIPQLNVGHAQLRQDIAAFEKRYPGLHFSGNYLCGVAVPAILQHAKKMAGLVDR